ncbi:membrane protein insertase YidC [Aeromicrobium sp.]|uniref:membrane protein insertase YidC n=1 Tax=Aeromicrobium sp. TaxID=1871063 RepID=UPI001996671E|nr:membrane protein insertase YidC [Aeromicrobium sp.]MBC7633933.1 membrane protein insertase YidC [Aeromicrobium sp.]
MFGFLGDIGSAIMTPLYYAVSAVLLAWHKILSTVLPEGSGWTWALAIVGLTVTIRALLIPLFVKQIKSSRNMQLLQPQIKELQKKYGHDRERLTQEQMKLWKDTGTNPFASCLPLILQMPIFFALFRVIDHAAKYDPIKDGEFHKGFMTSADATSLSSAKMLGAQIADTFVNSTATETKILTMSLVIIMCITQFTTQRQLMSKNMPADAMTGQYAQQQKLLLYILPVVFAVGGVAFPLGVLFYWTTSNLWTMGQQLFVIRNNPVPGTPAFKAKQERDQKHGKTVAPDPSKAAVVEAPKPPVRQQPKNQARSQRKKGGKK